MDRFFSKLDLRDIKIDPEKSRFLPDEDHPGIGPDVASGLETFAEDESVTVETSNDPVPGDEALEDEGEAESAQPLVDSPESRERAVYVDIREASGPASEVLKVSARSRPSAVAGAIAGVVRELGRAEVQAIGAGATNQAVKAVAIARDYLRETGIDAVCLPEFIDITIDDEDRTAIRLVVEPR